MSFKNLKEDVIDKGLCTSCGACAGVCPAKAINYFDRENKCIPELIDECIECGMCRNVCTAAGFDVKDLLNVQKKYFGEKEKKPDDSYGLCHANDMTVWQGSASGGFVTASLLYSLKKGIVDGVAVVGNDPEKPWLPKVAIVSSKNDILEAMQSKYCVIPTLEIIRDIAAVNKRVALVLLPCQAQAFINIKKKYPRLVKNVVYTIGLMCGNSLPFDATKDALNQIGVDDINKIRRLRYRDGLWHGNLHAVMEDGSEFSIPYEKYMRYMADFYRKDRCKVCIDGDAMFTDVSSGDGWLPGDKRDGVYGWSIIHTHTKTGEDLVEDLLAENEIYTIKLTEDEAKSQKHMFERHYSAIPRIRNRKIKNIPVPEYTGLEFPPYLLSKKHLVKKSIVDKMTGFLFSAKVRRFIQPIPISTKSGMLEFIMKLWFREK